MITVRMFSVKCHPHCIRWCARVSKALERLSIFVLLTNTCVNLCLARAYMSLFDRYDQNEAELFLRNATFFLTPQRRFEDLFEHIHRHFQRMQILSTSDDSLRTRGSTTQSMAPSNDSVRHRAAHLCAPSRSGLLPSSRYKSTTMSMNRSSMTAQRQRMIKQICSLRTSLIYLFSIR